MSGISGPSERAWPVLSQCPKDGVLMRPKWRRRERKKEGTRERKGEEREEMMWPIGEGGIVF